MHARGVSWSHATAAWRVDGSNPCFAHLLCRVTVEGPLGPAGRPIARLAVVRELSIMGMGSPLQASSSQRTTIAPCALSCFSHFIAHWLWLFASHKHPLVSPLHRPPAHPGAAVRLLENISVRSGLFPWPPRAGDCAHRPDHSVPTRLVCGGQQPVFSGAAGAACRGAAGCTRRGGGRRGSSAT